MGEMRRAIGTSVGSMEGGGGREMRRRHLALAGDEVVVGWSSVSGVQAVSDFGCSCAPGRMVPCGTLAHVR